MTDNLLEQGISAAITGRRAEARALLTQVVEADERNERAWLWLSGLVENPEDIRTCLENVLHINPENGKAQHGLAWIEQHHGASPAAAPVTAATPPEQHPPALSDSVSAEPASPEKPDPSPVLAVAELPPIQDPCPFCGAATPRDAKRCPGCGKDLMAPIEGREQRSRALKVLGVLWGLGGVFSLLGAGLTIFAIVLLQRNSSFSMLTTASLARAGLSLAGLYGQLAGGVFYGIFQLVIARGLLRRRRWAWIVSAVLLALQLLVALGIVLFFTVLMRMLSASLSGGMSRSGSPLGSVILAIVLLLVFAPQIVSLLLHFFSYGDVFVPMQRLAPRVGVVNPATHYNNGLDYKNRGMWYMAAQEWASAVRHAPYEPSFLHALGLAFVQLRQFDRARITLDFALQVAPADPGIRDSRSLVDKVEKRKW